MGVIYDGLNITQIAKLFRQNSALVKDKIERGGCKPVGRRHNADIYRVDEVAPHLIKPSMNVETYIRQMHPSELPKMLTKEYWAGQRSKQEYESRAGNLWPTGKVVEEVGELVKVVKMSALLMLDGVERQSELSERQREVIRSLTHGMLADMERRVIEKFKATPVDELPPEDSNEQLQEVEDGEDL